MPKYILTNGRYIDNKYYAADPENPIEIDLPEGVRVSPNDRFLKPAVAGESAADSAVKLQPHFAPKDSVAKLATRPIAPGHQEKEPATDVRGDRKKDRSL